MDAVVSCTVQVQYDPDANAAPHSGVDKLSRASWRSIGGNITAPMRTKRPSTGDLDAQTRDQIIDSHRLAYIDEVPVNWCPKLGTVLANEEVTNEGRSERGNHPVYRRALKQWMLRITTYAQRLLDDIETVNWPEPIKLMQRNWIGKSIGAEVDFPLQDIGTDEWFEARKGRGFGKVEDGVVRVYTTRPDTLFGATFAALSIRW